jgi:hypothetical protein
MPSTLRAARNYLEPLVLFCINAYICARLWTAEYIDQMGSVEGAFIAFSRYIAGHWHNLRWFPEWFCGMPVLRVYQPGLHVTVAAIATLFDVSPPRAYHFMSALVYSLGPVTLFWLCDRLTGRRGYAFAVGLVYSLFSPSVLLSTALRQDLGGWLLGRRYQDMVHYGDTPHIAGLALLPLVIWSLHRAIASARGSVPNRDDAPKSDLVLTGGSPNRGHISNRVNISNCDDVPNRDDVTNRGLVLSRDDAPNSRLVPNRGAAPNRSDISSRDDAPSCGLGPSRDQRERFIFIPLAAALLGALVVVNWTATIGLVMALVAYFVAQARVMRRVGWFTAAGIGILAYLLACPWLPPSVILDVPANAQYSDGTSFGRTQIAGLAACLIVLALLHLVFERFHISRDFRFFLYFFVLSGTVQLAHDWGNIRLIPQPHRFHAEMEMGLIPAVLFPVAIAWNRLSRSVRWTVLIVFAALCCFQVRTYHAFAFAEARPIDVRSTIEYRMAKWFEEHTGDERVFAPGSVALWMNNFVDTPQFLGCCDQSIPAYGMRLALFTIYTSFNAGDRDAEYSQLWLRAYGVGAIGIGGPQSGEYYKAFANPRKFDGILPELWRDGDNVVYRLPRRDRSLAHVIWPRQEVQRLPIHGLDVDPLRPYVAALDDPTLPPAEMRWMASNRIGISARMEPGQVISVQESYAPGWRATANGRTAGVRKDVLGLLVVEPDCAGPCTIDLVYDGGAEVRWLRILQIVGLLGCVAWALALRRGIKFIP